MSAGQVSIIKYLDAIGHLIGLKLQKLIVIAILIAIHEPIYVSIHATLKLKMLTF